MFEIIINLLMASVCSMSVATVPTDATIICVSQEDKPAELQHAAGWYNGYTDEVFVQDDLGFQYTLEVIAHEIAHRDDLAKGTALNGYPSFFSETHTGFDVEQWARMVTYVNGDWPANEVFPDVIPSEEDISRMRAANWL